MHFYIDTAGFYAMSHFTTPKALSSGTRSRYYSSLTGYARFCLGLLANQSWILSGTVPVLYFPHSIPESFKCFDAPLIAALALTMSLHQLLRDITATILRLP